MFAEFDDAATLLAANPDATTISRRQEPGREEDDELLGTDDSDKTEVMLFHQQCPLAHTRLVLTALRDS